MALDRRRIYFNAVLGGVGGLVGWAGSVLVNDAVPSESIYIRYIYVGLTVGACIGAALGCTEGLIQSPSWKRTLLGAIVGAVIGGLGGGGGLVLAEWLYGLVGGGLWPRAVGWATFGTLVGTADGIARRMLARIRYGAIGGLIGGLLGGSTYQRLTDILAARMGDRAAAGAWAGAVGLILVGLCIGAFIGLVESLLRVAWVTFLNGRFEGQSRTLDPARAVTTLGSSDACNVILRGDRSVADVHAEITTANGRFSVRSRNGAVVVERGGPLPSAPSYELRPGDRLHLGSQRLVFHAEERKA
jgi:hypothetical protein